MMIRLYITLFALLASCGLVEAHAMLDRTSPAVGSTMTAPPRAVTLTFTEKIEPAFSSVRVEDASGARVDRGKPQTDRGSRNVLRVNLKALGPGSYKVVWKVLSVDTHRTEGSFNFQVGH
jgi:methionine-rich copper-binding protein CopC